jgi:hypothetical protein
MFWISDSKKRESKIRNNRAEGLSSGFDDLASLKAASANANALSATADKGANRLKVRLEPSVGTIVSVAYAVTELRPLAAYFAAFRHCSIPPMRILL